jgi:ABC-type phosphate transport system auxiliary subunit
MTGGLRFNPPNEDRPAGRREKGEIMKLHAPALWLFVVSLVIAVIAVLGVFIPIPFVTMYGFWIAILAYVVLAVGNVVET